MKRQTGRWLGLAYYVALLIFLQLPILLLIVFSFNDSVLLVFPLKGFTLEWYEQLLGAKQLISAAGNSLIIGLVSSGVATTLGTLAAIAMALGATYWGTLMRVTLPISAPALVAAFLSSFTLSFDEFSLAFFLAGTQNTLPVYIYSQLRFPNRLPLAITTAAVVILFSVAILVFSEWLRRVGVNRKLRAEG